MSGKSNTPGSIISLPQGGGALQGMGETFSPDLQTGTGNFTVPISVPPGRNGFQPQLSLQYSTGNGNGPFGLGWNLSVPGVSRKTSSGIPQYDDTLDTFLLSGAEDLVPVPGAPKGATRYRPRTEGLFARIDHYRDAQNDYWDVRTKDGLRNLYGTPRPANATPDWQDPAVIADPSNRAHIFAWKLTLTLDPFGNRIEYAYDRDAVQTDGPHEWDQLYLSQIRYCDYGDSSAPQFLVSISFTYEQRPDLFSSYRSGFDIRTVQRCTAIDGFTHPGTDIAVRTYHLTYLDQQGTSAQLPPNGVSLLNQVQVEGHDGSASEWLPPLEFGYTQFQPEKRQFGPVTGPAMPTVSLADPNYELVDVFGNGLPDILEMNGISRYWRNVGNGHFARPQYIAQAPAGVQLSDPGVQLLDANGDGRVDLLLTKPNIAGYYSMRFEGFWDQRSFHRYSIAPSFDLEDPEVRLVDLNGDGVTDALRSDTRFDCFFNDPETGWGETRRVERKALDEFPNVNFSDPRVKWADLSGDGLQDIALVNDRSVVYWPNLGYGNWGKRIQMVNSPHFPYGYNPKRILVGDVDGDGVADMVYVDDRRITLWINCGGNRWTDPIVIEGTPPVSDTDAVRLVDLNGAGTAGILWSATATGLPAQRMFFFDFTGGVKPYLLDHMDNHIGSLTRVRYSSSTSFYLQDQQQLSTQWKTPLPFPVQVVARVESIDQISCGKLTTEYSYHHGYWDGVDREFRGFGRVDQRDTEVFSDYNASVLHDTVFTRVDPIHFSPPTETRTWFHLGPVGDEFGGWDEADFSEEYWQGDPDVLSRPTSVTAFLDSLPRRVKRDALRALRGRILRSELYALDGTTRQTRPYTVTEHLHGLAGLPIGAPWPANPADWQQRVFFPHTLVDRTAQWERGCEPLSRLSFTDNYDTYGLARRSIAIAVPRAGPANAKNDPHLATLTLKDYAQRDDSQLYLVNRPSRTTSYEIINDGSLTVDQLRLSVMTGSAATSLFSQTIAYYDGAAFAGLPFGQLGDYGAAVRTETLVLTTDILDNAFRSGPVVLSPPERPPYLDPNGPAWTADYPDEFRVLVPTLAGYTYQPGGGGGPWVQGYYATTERTQYDFQASGPSVPRGLPVMRRDPLGHDTSILYDPYDLLPKLVTNPLGLSIHAEYDYRVLQPSTVTDANGNQTTYAFSALGLLASIAVMGKPSEQVGDTLAEPSTRYVYDLLAYANNGQPISVRSIRRIQHANDTNIPPRERDATIETIAYSDGIGRQIQVRAQAEDVIFGDPRFGDAGLSPDQTAPPSDAVGVQVTSGAPPNVAVSGWQVYDNKGRVVQKYEPFFSTGWDYAPPTAADYGQRITIYYDGVGRAVRTVNPDQSEQRVIFGVPGTIALPDVTNPGIFEPTPWETFTYDANDNAGRTHPTQSASYSSHWNTPASNASDALGRTIQATVRNGANPATNWFATTSTYDIRGNLLTVTDPLGRLSFQHVYDLGNTKLRIEQLDAGVQLTILDAAGNRVEGRDSKGALLLRAYDAGNRAMRLWARDTEADPMTLRERLTYGDAADSGLTHGQAQAANLLGRLYQDYDEAGRATVTACDFKGNTLESTRQVILDSQLLSVFASAANNQWQVTPFHVDWTAPTASALAQLATSLLDSTIYVMSMTYDALNRASSMTYPQAVNGTRAQAVPTYNRAGALESMTIDGTTYASRIVYNANGQRTLIAYGNSVMTRYAYDPETFRLLRLCTEPYSQPSQVDYHPSGSPLQDLAYTYDLVGNVLTLVDRTPGSGVLNNPMSSQVQDPQLPTLLAAGDALLRTFTCDPLYRLLSATGRECADIPPPRPWSDDSRCLFGASQMGTPNQQNAPNLTRVYQEAYTYDPAGNITKLYHAAGNNTWSRYFGMGGMTPLSWSQAWQQHLNTGAPWTNPPGNRLTHVGDDNPSMPQTHTFDAVGNLTSETTSRHFTWDESNRLLAFSTQTAGAEPTVYAQYVYGANGQRIKKLVRKPGNQYDVTIYIGGIFEHRRSVQGASTQENNDLHVMDDKSRIALVRVGQAFRDDATPAVKYHLGDHLGSSVLVLDNTGSWVNREEYFPYGETSLGSYGRKRYRSTGKERDEETGLQYFGARYHAPWLGRWISCDPLAVNSGTDSSTYSYLHGRVLSAVDPTGLNDEFVTQNSEYGPGESAPGGTGGASPPSDASTPQPGDPNFVGPVQGIEPTPTVPAASAQHGKNTNSNGASDPEYQGPSIVKTPPPSNWEYFWSQLKLAPGRWLNANLWGDLGITTPVAPGPRDPITTGPLPKKEEARFLTTMTLASIVLPVALEADLSLLASGTAASTSELSIMGGGPTTGQTLQAMDPVKLARIVRNLEPEGVTFRLGDPTLLPAGKLGTYELPGVTYTSYGTAHAGGPGTISLAPNPSRLAVIHELGHLGQHRASGWSVYWASTPQMLRSVEIANNAKLLQITSVQWTQQESLLSFANLTKWWTTTPQ
jgi:RHS repeat-associated protein